MYSTYEQKAQFMKKLLLGLMMFALTTSVFADDAVKVSFRISGVAPDNRYFFCEPNIGCLSILAGDRGKVYSFFEPIEFHNAYVSNLQTYRVSGQPLPGSCSGTFQPGQSVVIYGHIEPAPNGNTYIAGLSCSVR